MITGKLVLIAIYLNVLKVQVLCYKCDCMGYTTYSPWIPLKNQYLPPDYTQHEAFYSGIENIPNRYHGFQPENKVSHSGFTYNKKLEIKKPQQVKIKYIEDYVQQSAPKVHEHFTFQLPSYNPKFQEITNEKLQNLNNYKASSKKLEELKFGDIINQFSELNTKPEFQKKQPDKTLTKLDSKLSSEVREFNELGNKKKDESYFNKDQDFEVVKPEFKPNIMGAKTNKKTDEFIKSLNTELEELFKPDKKDDFKENDDTTDEGQNTFKARTPEVSSPIYFDLKITPKDETEKDGDSQEHKDHHDDHHHDKNVYYIFEYSVNDSKTKDVKHQKEERKGDKIDGEYSLVEEDGNIRTVKYMADWKNGFHAQVINSKKN